MRTNHECEKQCGVFELVPFSTAPYGPSHTFPFSAPPASLSAAGILAVFTQGAADESHASPVA